MSNSRSRSSSRTSTNGDRIRCLRCREYDHFIMYFPTMKVGDITNKNMYNSLWLHERRAGRIDRKCV